MNQIVQAVEALPANVDAKIEPLNTRLSSIAQAIEALSNLSEDVRQIRGEFTGFRDFQKRIERYEESAKDAFKKFAKWVGFSAFGVIVAVTGAAYYVGSTMKGINDIVAQGQKDVGEIKGDVEELQAAISESNGTMKGHDERLKSIDEQLRAVQVSVREAPTRTAAEISDKTAERIAGEFQAFKKSVADMAGRFEAVERKVEEASDVLVLWLALNPEDKPVAVVGTPDTTLFYEVPVPPQQKLKALHANQRRSAVPPAAAVTFYDGDERLRPPGVIAATARPMREDGKVSIALFFSDKAARGEFEKFMDHLRDVHKPMRLKVTYTPG